MMNKKSLEKILNSENEKLENITNALNEYIASYDAENLDDILKNEELEELSLTEEADTDIQSLIIKTIREGANNNGILYSGLGSTNLCNIYYVASKFFKNACGVFDNTPYSDELLYMINERNKTINSIKHLKELLQGYGVYE